MCKSDVSPDVPPSGTNKIILQKIKYWNNIWIKLSYILSSITRLSNICVYTVGIYSTKLS